VILPTVFGHSAALLHGNQQNAMFLEYKLTNHQLCCSHEWFLKIAVLTEINAVTWYYAHSSGNAVRIIYFWKAFSQPFYVLQIIALLWLNTIGCHSAHMVMVLPLRPVQRKHQYKPSARVVTLCIIRNHNLVQFCMSVTVSWKDSIVVLFIMCWFYIMYLQVLRTFLIIASLENCDWTSRVIGKLIFTLLNDFIVAK